MLVLWIAALFFVEPLLFCAYAAGAVLLNKDGERPHRLMYEFIAACQLVVFVMLCVGLYEELDSLLKTAFVAITLVVANIILRPYIWGGIVLLLGPREHTPNWSHPVGRPWVFPGSHPPPGWDDEN